MGEKKKVVDAVVFLSIDFGLSGQLEHAIEADGWFLTFFVSFSNETGPHGVMKFEC